MFKWKYLGILIIVPLFIVPVSKYFNYVIVSTALVDDVLYNKNPEGHFWLLPKKGDPFPPFPIPIPIIIPKPTL